MWSEGKKCSQWGDLKNLPSGTLYGQIRICELRSDPRELAELRAHNQRFCTSNQEAPDRWVPFRPWVHDLMFRCEWDRWSPKAISALSSNDPLDIGPSCFIGLPGFFSQANIWVGIQWMKKKKPIRKNLMKFHAKVYREEKLSQLLHMSRNGFV